MGKTILFYNVGIYRNNLLTELNFIDFLDNISLIEWENRVRKVENNIVAIFPIIYNDSHKEKRIIPFGKFRLNYKPYTGNLKNPKYDEIKDNVVELVTLVYDSTYRTLAMDFSTYGAKQKLIEQYFSTFLPNEENNIWEVRLSPVINDFDENDLKNSSQIRSVQITLDLSKNQYNFLKQNNENNENNKNILNLFQEVKKTSDEYEANIVRLEFGASKNRKSKMNKQSILMLLQTLNIDIDSIKNIKIRYKDKKEKMEDIDLKNLNTILSTRVLENNNDKNPAPEYLGNTIIDVFNNFSGNLYKSQIQFFQDSYKENMPIILKEPKDINKIEVNL